MAKSNTADYGTIFKEFEGRVERISQLIDTKLPVLTRYFSAILSHCQNEHNQHFAENALILFTFVQYQIDALTSGQLPLDAQEKFYKGFISKQFGSFDKYAKMKSNTRLTSCCVEYLSSQTKDSDQHNLVDQLKRTLQTYSLKLQPMADKLVSALKTKTKGKGGFKFTLSVKYYTGYKYICECSADTDAAGNKIARVSDGDALLKHAVDVQKRDLLTEINSLSIAPLRDFPHVEIIDAEIKLIADETERLVAEQLAVERRKAQNGMLVQKKEEDKKRKREEAHKAEESRAAAESPASTVIEAPVTAKRGRPKKISVTTKATPKGRPTQSSAGDDDDLGSDEEDDGGFTLRDYKGGPNDAKNLHKHGRTKPGATGDLDLIRDGGYDDIDDNVVSSLRDPLALKNFILRGGQMNRKEISSFNQDVAKLRDVDDEWDVPANKKPSLLDTLDFDGCESPDRSRNYLNSNFIDKDSSSDEDSYTPRVRGVSSAEKPKKARKRNATSKRNPSIAKSSRKSRGNDSDSTAHSDGSSSDSDAKSKKRKRRAVPKATALKPVAEDASHNKDAENADGTKVRKREAVGLTEHQVTQYANINLMPFQLTAVQHRNARDERFEVDGQLMSEEEIKNLIIDDVEIIDKNIDAKFLSFIRQHIMVEVFKDVYFLSNVITFYRAKRHLHNTQPGDHVICLWQEVLKQVATDLIEELVKSNEKILSKMDKNLKELKEMRRKQRHEETLIIGSEEEVERNAQDYKDLSEYKNQMKLSKRALEEIEKVMKRRINSYCHSTGAKIVCIWAKLNGYQHLLSGNMTKFEKKFLLDGTIPFYSVLSDLSRRWTDVATSPNSLFPGVDLAGRNAAASDINNVSDRNASAPSFEMLDDAAVESSVEINSHEMSTEEESTNEVLSPSHLSSPALLSTPSSPQHIPFDGAAEENTPPQDVSLTVGAETYSVGEVDASRRQDDSFVSPLSEDFRCDTEFSSAAANKSMPARPSKSSYNSALLSSSSDRSPFSQMSQDFTEHYMTSSGSKEFLSPSTSASAHRNSVASTQQRRGGMFSVTSRPERSSVSYLSSVSTSGSSSNCSPIAGLCESNAAVLFDEVKHNMDKDARTEVSMFRFIKVMNEKPSNVQMPVTVEEEDKILSKAAAKQKKEDAKKTAAAEDAKTAAALLTSAVASSAVIENLHSSLDDHGFDASHQVGGARLKTDSYSLFQKLFLFICKKHVEVKDSVFNLQFFGQRLARSMSNSALLKFLLLLFRNKDKTSDYLAVYLLDEKLLCAELNCVFGFAHSANEYFSIIGDGYCVQRSMFALKCNELSGYNMSVADMRAADIKLFKSKKSRGEFYGFLNGTRESVNIHCLDETVKAADKKKLKTTMTLFAAYPQLKQIPAAYWGCLDWVAYAQMNCTAFSTNYSDCVPGYAQLHCSSVVPRDMSMSIPPYSVGDIHRILNEPLRPNFCVLEGQHTFVVKSPSKHAAVSSFQSVLGMFLSECLKSVGVLAADHSANFPLVEDVMAKMLADNAYTLTEAEAKVMSDVIKSIDKVSCSADNAVSDKVVLCVGICEPPVSLEAFVKSRVDEGVIDLCDSDTGDVDRVKIRSMNLARLAKQEQELSVLKFKLEASERENKFLLRLIGKDPLLMHNPPLEIDNN